MSGKANDKEELGIIIILTLLSNFKWAYYFLLNINILYTILIDLVGRVMVSRTDKAD